MNWTRLNEPNPILEEILNDWISLLRQDRKEKEYHDYIKNFAGFFLVDRIGSYLAISKLKLGSRLELDFAIPREEHSRGLYWELIEIKTPQVAPYNEAGNPSSKLAEAVQQIVDWKRWLKDNRRESEKLFLTSGVRSAKDPNFEYKIIIGNRENSTKYLEKRNDYAKAIGIEIRSFDYLTDRLKHRVYLNKVFVGDGTWDEKNEDLRISLANPFVKAFTDSSWKKLLSEPGVCIPHFTSRSCSHLIVHREINETFFEKFMKWQENA